MSPLIPAAFQEEEKPAERRTKVKICGLSRTEDIFYVNEACPDYVGFVFAKSRRQVEPSQAAALRRLLRREICPVGVFVNQKPEEILRLLRDGTIEAVQLHGQETEEQIRLIRQESGKKVIKAVRITDGRQLDAWKESSADYLLLDGGYGDGKVFDWSVAEKAKSLGKPFFLAGGLNACNAAEAVRLFEPYALDLSSGVENAGVKDRQKILDFMRAVRLAGKERENCDE